MDGEWVVAPGSEAGFRADVLDVPAEEAVLLGTTPDVTGTLRVVDGELETATVTVATTALRTGSSVADRQLQQALEADLYPTTLFSLTSPLDVSELASTREAVRLQAAGALTIRDETQPVTVALDVRRSGQGCSRPGRSVCASPTSGSRCRPTPPCRCATRARWRCGSSSSGPRPLSPRLTW